MIFNNTSVMFIKVADSVRIKRFLSAILRKYIAGLIIVGTAGCIFT